MGNGREIFEFVLDKKSVIAGFSTRYGGVSSGPFDSLNLSLSVGDDEKNVLTNREILRKFLGLKSLVFMNQIHSNDVKNISKADENPQDCDAIVTNLKDTGLCVMVADCSPILLYDAKNLAIAVIHAGRAGVLKKIVSKTFEVLKSEFGTQSDDILAFVGANIKSKCYEIGDMDLGEFNKFKIGKNFDLNLALRSEFCELDFKNVKFSSFCSHCDERFFSYRKEQKTGRFAGIIALRS